MNQRFTAASQQLYHGIFRDFPALEKAFDTDLLLKEMEGRSTYFIERADNWTVEIGKVYVKFDKYVRIVYHFCPKEETEEERSWWGVGQVIHARRFHSLEWRMENPDIMLFDGHMTLTPDFMDMHLTDNLLIIFPEMLEQYIRRHVREFPPEYKRPNLQLRAEVRKYVPSKRMLVHITSADAGVPPLYVKYYHNQHGQFSAQVQTELSGKLREASTLVEVPRVYFYDREHNFLWQEDWGGSSLKEARPALTDRESWEVVFRAINVLHQLEPPGMVKNRMGPDHYLNDLVRDVQYILNFLPEQKDLLEQVEEKIIAVLKNVEAPMMLLHGSLFPAQVLRRNGNIAFIDFDSVSLGDPWYDVSEFLSGLLYEEWIAGTDWQDLQPFRRFAVERYSALSGVPASPEVVQAYFTMFFLNKIQQHLKMLKPVPENFLSDIQQICRELLEENSL